MTSEQDVYVAIGVLSPEREQVQNCLAKVRAKIKAMANEPNVDHSKFSKAVDSAKRDTLKELESIIGKEKVERFMEHLVAQHAER